MKEEVSFSEILERGLDKFNIVDVRSPSEFAHDHIPGAVNIPLLDDEERRIVGTIYKQEGPKDARIEGVRLVSPKLPEMIGRYLEIKKNNKQTVVYCWRGGLRSFAASGLVRIAGVSVSKITGGYKTYRSYINEFFDNFNDKYRFMTLYGPTGCAKSEILRSLADNYPVLDLEAYACHKGSSFGSVDEPDYGTVTQKNFESALWSAFEANGVDMFLTEGESRKIGRVNIPKRMFEKMTSDISVVISAPIDFRIAFTIENYKPDRYVQEIRSSLLNIKKYLGKKRVDELSKMLDEENYEDFTKILLLEYYDPLYKHSYPQKADYELEITSIQQGIEEIGEIYEDQRQR